MRILSNPGANLTRADADRYGFELLPQKIVVDGVHHDTREDITFAQIDEWVRTAREHPYVLGTSAAECSEQFRQLLKTDKRLVMITVATALVGTYKAATAAARAVSAASPDAAIDVIDTRSIDLGSAMAAIVGAQAVMAGKSQRDVVSLIERFASGGHVIFKVAELDYMVKGGRAGVLRAWLADMLNVSPLLSFVAGNLEVVGRISRKDDAVPAIIDAMKKRIPPGARVWAGVGHAANESAAERLAAATKATWKVERLYVRPVAATTYLNVGAGSFGLFLHDVSEVPWLPESEPT